jgi:hypothetical protein
MSNWEMIKIKTHWKSASTLDDDKSGVGVFEIPGQTHSIKFDNFNDYYFILKAIGENARLVKEAELHGIKSEISVLIENAIKYSN